jgi:hypothetical protein
MLRNEESIVFIVDVRDIAYTGLGSNEVYFASCHLVADIHRVDGRVSMIRRRRGLDGGGVAET